MDLGLGVSAAKPGTQKKYSRDHDGHKQIPGIVYVSRWGKNNVVPKGLYQTVNHPIKR